MELALELSRLIKQDKSKAITYFNFFESFIFYYTWSLRVFEAKDLLWINNIWFCGH